MSDTNEVEVKVPSEPVVEKMAAEEVIDVDRDPNVVQGWYNEAKEVQTYEGLQKLSERLLGGVSMTSGTTPHAYASIVLAGLKMALASKHGSLSKKQWTVLKDMLDSAIENAAHNAPDK